MEIAANQSRNRRVIKLTLRSVEAQISLDARLRQEEWKPGLDDGESCTLHLDASIDAMAHVRNFRTNMLTFTIAVRPDNQQ